ncbi:serine/threonine-protein kinase [Sorangium atrum]|uniref:Serine/threonine-protein kinase n=1 Tax=Sorangium atrum TaxID=2995308 RepID=A0ABT5BUL5_9BACT|nr:serine/threonine-protein kinase [Sorangium aterium]MDC0677829.1 serine/threonine-protein kinase [Sorangium aterium]
MTRVNPEGFRPEALVGQVLRGKWRLERLLGFGGMAMVYAATHRNGMRGAVKILRRELSEDEEARSRFLREGYVANRVEHPGIVRVLDDDVTEDGSVFLVMELLEGETVEARRAREPGGVLAVSDVLGIADDLLDVLAVAHERGIVHRDLKPDNLFLTRQGQLKVLDFGIARLRELSSPANASTRAGTLMGTPQFMPPEQARGQWDRVDPRSDLWAVGSTMYQLLSGRYVHEAETLPLLLLAAMTQPAPPVGSVLPALPPPIAGVMDVALAFDPDRRWPNARAMQRALRQARGGAALDPAPGAPPPGRAPLHSEHGRALLHSDPPGRPSAQARGPGSGPRGTEFAAAGTASGVAAGGGAASTGTVSPVVERSASGERSAPRAAAAGVLLAGAGALAVGALVALVWWQRAGARGAEDPSHGSTVEAEPRLTAGAGATTAPPDSAGSLGAGVQPAPSGDAVPAIAPSAPATTPEPEAAPTPAAAPASASAAAPRPAAGGRARSPATATKAPATPTPAPAPTPAEDPYNRRR